MEQSYQKLSDQERAAIMVQAGGGHSARSIARSLGCHVSTVSRRELARGRDDGGSYCAIRAAAAYQQRRRRSGRPRKLVPGTWLYQWVQDRLCLFRRSGDTVLHGHKQSGMVTLVERRSGYLLAERLTQLKAQPTAQAIIRQFRRIRGAVKTAVTFDNGFEFAAHQRVGNTLSAATYFCDPYRSSQRGTNENTNRLLRQYFPNGTDFSKLSDHLLKETVKRPNDRPRKPLGYRTPAEVFWGEYSGALNTGGAAFIT